MSKRLAAIGEWMLRRPVIVVVLLGVLLYLPSLGTGFMADDAYHLGILESPDLFPDLGPISLYTFVDGQADRMGPLQGDLKPWWASENFRMNFFRPVAGIVHWIDHRLYGKSPLGYHISTLILWGLLLLMVMYFFKSLAGDSKRMSAALLVAGVFFAFDDAHVLNIAWIANRYSLLGALFSVGAIWQYHLYRSRGRRMSLYLALIFLWLGFFSDEGSIAAPAWIVAYELVLGHEKPTRRILCMTPFLCSAVAYLVFYFSMGYGAAGSECYLDPLSDPLAFFSESVAVRLPFLVMGALTPLPAELSFNSIGTGAIWPLTLAWLSGGAILIVLVSYVRHKENAAARFMLIGAMLSMFPRIMVYPHNRMLLLPSVGLAWVIADYVLDAGRRWRAMFARRHLALGVAVLLVLVHGVMAPIQTVMGNELHRRKSNRMLDAALKSDLPDPSRADQARVVLLTTSPSGYFVPGLRWAAGLGYPAAVWVVTMGKGEFSFKRTGSNSFSVVVLEGDLLKNIAVRLCRDDFNFSEGDRFKQGAMQVVIRRVVEGRVKEFIVAIDRPLDDADVWLVAWDGERFVRVPPLPWKYPWRHKKP